MIKTGRLQPGTEKGHFLMCVLGVMQPKAGGLWVDGEGAFRCHHSSGLSPHGATAKLSPTDPPKNHSLPPLAVVQFLILEPLFVMLWLCICGDSWGVLCRQPGQGSSNPCRLWKLVLAHWGSQQGRGAGKQDISQ